MGAWIETSRRVVSNNHQESHPEWVRGLKLLVAGRIGGLGESHPEWVRGLKREDSENFFVDFRSHPEWVRGLKHILLPCPC